MASKKEKLIIIDGNALIHRSFHALPPTMTTKKGEIVNAVYGFTTVLLKAIKDIKPEYVVLTLDKKGPTFRHEEYKEYKATRVKAPDELYEQIPKVKEVVQSLNIPIYELSGFEADDLIGTIARQVDGQVEKVILTGDMDTLQLINDHTRVYTLSRGLSDSVIYDEEKVQERYGLSVGQMIDYKALRGDPSDNIPGVRGIGEKTATELLKTFGTLENLYESINDPKFKIKERIANLLIEHKEDALMSKRLATIKTDSPIEFDLSRARFGTFNEDDVFKLFSEFEFRSLLPRVKELQDRRQEINKESEVAVRTEENKFERNLRLFKYELVNDDKKFGKFLEKLRKQKEFAFDTETANFDPVTAQLLGISFCWQEGEAYYLEIRSQDQEIKNNLFNYNKVEKNIRGDWLIKLKPIFENERIKKYGHNIKFDIEVMASYNIKVSGIAGDSMVASYVLNPGTRQHNLDALAFSEFGFQKISKDDLLGKGKEKTTYGEVAVEKLFNYSCEDADFTWRLIKKLLPEIKKEKLEKLYDKIEVPLILVLTEMEINGIKINTDYLETLRAKTAKKITALQKEIWDLAGSEFNVNSTQQLREVLFEKLNLPTDGITKTKTGLSTGADELEKLKDKHEIIAHILDYRELVKLQSTYIESLPELVNKKTGRVHTSYNQSVTATGRLSSTDPNMQNIPVRTEFGREIRRAFVAEKGYKLLSLDYSQIELRLAAHMSGDKKMIAAFKNDLDIHAATAAEINQVELVDVTKEMRREAKATNFGILYGQGAHGLAQTADIPYWRAKEFIENYFKVYSEIKKYIEKTISFAQENGYVETLFGRRRYLPEINSSVVMVRKGAERMAINTPIQGTAADMIKKAMIETSKFLSGINHQDVRMLLQVHDELLFEVKENKVQEVAKQVKNIMEGVMKLKVPIVAEAKAGDDWGEMEKLENKN